MIGIRPILPEDLAGLVAVWQEAFGARWPADSHALAGMAGFLTEDAAGIAGVVLCDDLALLALYVRPDVQHTGIGTALHQHVLDAAHGAGHALRLGAGRRYFWPGVPVDAAPGFFEQQGWVWDHEVVDLVADLPLELLPARPGDLDVQLTTLDVRPELYPSLTMFAERDFPQWAAAYQATDPAHLLVACAADQLVGAAVLTPPNDPMNPVRWADLFGTGMGALGAVGVAPAVEGRGVGSQLVVAGADWLATKGATQLYLGWVWRTSFYERLGCQVWRRYRVAATRTVA